MTEIPTNREIARVDHDDEVYRTSGERDEAVIELILKCRSRQQPVLVGTISIDKSERLSAELNRRKIEHKGLECSLS